MKFFGKSFNFLSVFILLILLSYTMQTKLAESAAELNLSESSNQNQNIIMGTFTDKQQKEFDSIKKPELPNQMPEDVRFMQKEISKAYNAAKIQYNPRFMESELMSQKFMSLFPEDKRQVGVPVNREG